MKKYQSFLKQIDKEYRNTGYKFVASVQTHLYGKTPHVGKDTWHHEVFRPLKEKEIVSLGAEIGIVLPEPLRRLYLVANGLRLFSDEIAIYGLRFPGRSGDSTWQPYSLVEPNTLERPSDSTKEEIFIGGYSYDGSLVKLKVKTGSVEACKPDSAKKTFARWPDLATFLIEEFKRLRTHFNDKLELLDPDGSTLPG
jgi:hypothetical protein